MEYLMRAVYSSGQSLYILIHKPGSRQVAILAVYVGTTVA